jgi:dihydroorotate dehydrogenase electron transfer subunit
LKAVFTSIKLEKILWKGPRQILLQYRFVEEPVEYPPGTFTLFWYPGLEAIPLTPIPLRDRIAFFVAVRGFTTRKIYENPPVYAGLIGPLGKPFQLSDNINENILFIAGGAGIAALASIIQAYENTGKMITLIYEARTRDEIPPLKDFLGANVRVEYATEDGSWGFKGTVVKAAENIVTSEDYDVLIAAGPKTMLCSLYNSKLRRIFKPERIVMAVETYVKCGLGFCGKCIIPSIGKRLCVDGMFYSLKELGEGWYSLECRQT